MNGGLVDRFLSSCRHQFTWPRREDNGDYYQLCVHCGAKYRYDWSRMRRLSLVEDEEGNATKPTSLSNRSSRARWVPRERRLRHRVTVQFRSFGTSDWSEATSENLSRSGLLFRHRSPLRAGTELELVFEMPEELAGYCPAQAFCRGSVVRATPDTAVRKQGTYLIACAIHHCELKAAQAG